MTAADAGSEGRGRRIRRLAAGLAARRVGLLVTLGAALGISGFVSPIYGSGWGGWAESLGTVDAVPWGRGRKVGLDDIFDAATTWLAVLGPAIAAAAFRPRWRGLMAVAGLVGLLAISARALADGAGLAPWSAKFLFPGILQPGAAILAGANVCVLAAAFMSPGRRLPEAPRASRLVAWLPLALTAWCAGVQPDPVGDGLVAGGRWLAGREWADRLGLVDLVRATGWRRELRWELAEACLLRSDRTGAVTAMRLIGSRPSWPRGEPDLFERLARSGMPLEDIVAGPDPTWAAAAIVTSAQDPCPGARAGRRALLASAAARHGKALGPHLGHVVTSLGTGFLGDDLPEALAFADATGIQVSRWGQARGPGLWFQHGWDDLVRCLEDPRVPVEHLAWGALVDKAHATVVGSETEEMIHGPSAAGSVNWTVNGRPSAAGWTRSSWPPALPGWPAWVRMGAMPFTPDQVGRLAAWVESIRKFEGPDGAERAREALLDRARSAIDPSDRALAAQTLLRYPRRFFADDLPAALDALAGIETALPSPLSYWSAWLSTYAPAALAAALDDPRPVARRLAWHALLWQRHVRRTGKAPGDFLQGPEVYDPVTGDPANQLTLDPEPDRPPFDPDAPDVDRAGRLAALREWLDRNPPTSVRVRR